MVFKRDLSMTNTIKPSVAYTIVCLTEHVAQSRSEYAEDENFRKVLGRVTNEKLERLTPYHLAPLEGETSHKERIMIVNAAIIIDQMWDRLSSRNTPVEYKDSFDFDFVPLAAKHLNWMRIRYHADIEEPTEDEIDELTSDLIICNPKAFICS